MADPEVVETNEVETTLVGGSAAAKAAAEADMDAFLAKNDADDSRYGAELDDEPSTTTRLGTPKAKPESKAPKDEPAQAESEGAGDEPEAEGEEGVNAADYEKALAAIRRDGLDPDSLRWGRKRLVEHGLKRAEAYAKQESNWRELQEKYKAAEERANQKKESAGNATPTTDEPFDLNGALEPFRNELGEESAKALANALQVMHGRSTARTRELEEKLDQANRNALMSLFEAARGRLSGRFPALADHETWQGVGRKAASFMETGNWDSIDAAVLDAAKVNGLEDHDAERKREAAEKANAARNRGVPTGKSRRSAPATKSDEQIEFESFAELEKKHGYTDGDDF